MGLDGFVPCNCFPNRLRTPPPCPIDWLHWTDGHLELLPEHDSDSLWHRLQKWSESACPHRGFRRIWQRVGNWTGIALFLESIEAQDFPILKRLEGQLEWPLAAQGLQEIARFRQLPRLNEATELMLGDQILHSYTAYNEGIFLLHPKAGLNAGVDPNGFFLISRETGQEVFRARKFQHLGHSFRNLEDGTTFETPLDFEKGQMEVRNRAHTPADFEYLVEALTALYSAAVEVRRTLYWT